MATEFDMDCIQAVSYTHLDVYKRQIIYWMLNDCWPAAAGWSFLDYYNVPKAAFYSFKRCAAPIMASIDYENGVYRVYVSNDLSLIHI